MQCGLTILNPRYFLPRILFFLQRHIERSVKRSFSRRETSKKFTRSNRVSLKACNHDFSHGQFKTFDTYTIKVYRIL